MKTLYLNHKTEILITALIITVITLFIHYIGIPVDAAGSTFDLHNLIK